MERLRRRALSFAPGLLSGRLRGLIPFALAGMAACGGDATPLEVRTTLPGALLDEVEAAFEEAHAGVDLRFSNAPDPASLDALRSGDADFDVWWGAPALALERARSAGLLVPYAPEWLSAASAADSAVALERLLAGEAGWRPVLTTPFVLAFDRREVALGDAPTDWIDVFHHAWYQAVRVPDPAGSEAGGWLAGSMIVEALRDQGDLLGGFDWLGRLHRQVDLYAQEPDEMVGALRRGDALLAIMTRADAEAARTADAPWLHYRIPASGTPELIRGVGIVAASDAPEAARDFVEFLGSDVVATASKLHTRWEPVAGQVDGSRLPADFELDQSWRPYTPAVDTLAAELGSWIDRWEAEIAIR